MEQIITHGSVIRGWLGVEVQEMTPELAKSFNLASTNGVLITAVNRSGPAYMAGIKPGDVLLKVDSIVVESSLQVMNQITMTAPGDSITMEIQRDGQRYELTTLIGRRATPR